jgi:streptogramin lyase
MKLSHVESVAVDLSGDAWAAGTSGIYKLTATGTFLVAISQTCPYCQTLDHWGIAIDGSGDGWITDQTNGAVEVYSPTGTVFSPWPNSPGYQGNGVIPFPQGIAIDTSENVWIASDYPFFGDYFTELSSSGQQLIQAVACYVQAPRSVAIDHTGNVWISGGPYASGLCVISPSHSFVSPGINGGFTGGGLNGPQGIAIDGAGDVWTANYNGGTVSEFSSNGVAISPPTGYFGGGMYGLFGLALDGSGNVWVCSNLNSRLIELVGGAAPVVTPIVAGVKNNALGTRP